MCDYNQSCPVVVHVADRRCRPRANLLIGRALRVARARGEICLRCVDVETAEESVEVVARRSPDAVIAPRRLHARLAERLRPECSLFDFDRLFEPPNDHSRIFIDIPGTGHGFLDEAGRIGLGGFDGADRFP